MTCTKNIKLSLDSNALPLPVLTDLPRLSTTWIYHCHAPDDVFVPEYDDMSPECRAIIEARNGIPCEGGGVPGPWCEDSLLSFCPWAKHEELDDDIRDW